MKFPSLLPGSFLFAVLLAAWPSAAHAKSYSSGGGHSYSSHSSSSAGSHSSSSTHSFSSPSHSFSSGSGSSHGSSSSSSSSSSHGSSSGVSDHKSSSSSGKSYSSGSSSDDSNRHSYSSGKSYGSGGGSIFSSSSKHNYSSTTGSSKSGSSSSSSDDFTFDTAAARARKEQASKDTFANYNDSQKPPPIRNDSPTAPPIIPRAASTRTHHDTIYIPDATTLSTRSVRVQNVFQSYYPRPVVRYRDPYSSLFWWWLLDQSREDRAMWAYQHRSDMDAARYEALVNQDAQLEARVQQLEAQQTPVNPAYVPANLDRDLMYTDDHLQHAYQIRPTTQGTVTFAIFGWILIACTTYCFIWLVFIHRWKTSSQT